MNKLVKHAFLVAASLVTLSVAAQEIKDIAAKTPYSAYVQDSRGVITRNPYGLCWHTGYWTPADSVPGCDGEIAQAPAAPMPQEPAPVVKRPVAAAPVAEKVTYAADAFFDFDKSVIKPAAKEKLDALVDKLNGIDIEVLVAVGHTDSVGSDAYNQKLSIRRAKAVKAYLVSKGIDASRIYTEGRGEKMPVATNKTAAGRAQNRRVEVEVVGTRR